MKSQGIEWDIRIGKRRVGVQTGDLDKTTVGGRSTDRVVFSERHLYGASRNLGDRVYALVCPLCVRAILALRERAILALRVRAIFTVLCRA